MTQSPKCPRYKTEIEHDLPSANRWSIREDHSDIRRPIEGAHPRIWGTLGRPFTLGGIHLPLVEFTYNNSYQTTIGMTPYEALFGRKCRTLVCWHEIGERKLLGPELVHITTDKVKVIRKRMKEAQDRQKSYINHRRWPLEFSRGDKVFRFEMKGKLAPWYIGLFEILERIGSVAYQLKLPLYLEKIHSIFHMSLLRKVEIDPSWFPIEIKEDLTLEVKPMKILDQSEKELRIRKFN